MPKRVALNGETFFDPAEVLIKGKRSSCFSGGSGRSAASKISALKACVSKCKGTYSA